MAGVVPKLSRTPGAIRHGGPGARRAHRRGAARRRAAARRRRSRRYAPPAWSGAGSPSKNSTFGGSPVDTGGRGRREQLVRFACGPPRRARVVVRAELDHDPVRVVRCRSTCTSRGRCARRRGRARASGPCAASRSSRSVAPNAMWFTKFGSPRPVEIAGSKSGERRRRAGPRSRAARRCRCRRRGDGPSRLRGTG